MRFFTFALMFDSFYISFLNYLKPKFGRKSMTLAFHYISIVEIAFYALLACFFAAFSNQLNIVKISPEKAITISVLCVLFIYGKNWMRYNGKRRMVLNAKSRKAKVEKWKLAVLPIACIVLAVVFFQAI